MVEGLDFVNWSLVGSNGGDSDHHRAAISPANVHIQGNYFGVGPDGKTPEAQRRLRRVRGRRAVTSSAAPPPPTRNVISGNTNAQTGPQWPVLVLADLGSHAAITSSRGTTSAPTPPAPRPWATTTASPMAGVPAGRPSAALQGCRQRHLGQHGRRHLHDQRPQPFRIPPTSFANQLGIARADLGDDDPGEQDRHRLPAPAPCPTASASSRSPPTPSTIPTTSPSTTPRSAAPGTGRFPRAT